MSDPVILSEPLKAFSQVLLRFGVAELRFELLDAGQLRSEYLGK